MGEVARKTILAQEIYCAKPNTKPDSHYGSWVHKGLGIQAPRIIKEYNLATAISIWPLIQPLTCKMCFNFCGHELTQSGKYDLGLLTHHPINQE